MGKIPIILNLVGYLLIVKNVLCLILRLINLRLRVNNPVHKILKTIRRKCRLENIPYNLKKSDIVIPEKCPVLGIDIVVCHENRDFWPSVDRIDPKGDYVKDNIIVVSYRANRLKSNTTPEGRDKLIAFYEQISH